MTVHYLFFWRYRDPIRKKKAESITRYRCTQEEARARFGDSLIGPVDGSLELRAAPTAADLEANRTSAWWKKKD
jgi:hypothetical protein